MTHSESVTREIPRVLQIREDVILNVFLRREPLEILSRLYTSHGQTFLDDPHKGLDKLIA